MAEIPTLALVANTLGMLKEALPITELREYQDALTNAAAYQEDMEQGVDRLDGQIRRLSSSLMTLSRTGIAELMSKFRESTSYIATTNQQLLVFIESVEKKFPGASGRAVASIDAFIQKHKAMRDGIVEGNKNVLESARALALLEGNGQAAAVFSQLRSSSSFRSAGTALASATAGLQNLQLGVGESKTGQMIQASLKIAGESLSHVSKISAWTELIAGALVLGAGVKLGGAVKNYLGGGVGGVGSTGPGGAPISGPPINNIPYSSYNPVTGMTTQSRAPIATAPRGMGVGGAINASMAVVGTAMAGYGAGQGLRAGLKNFGLGGGTVFGMQEEYDAEEGRENEAQKERDLENAQKRRTQRDKKAEEARQKAYEGTTIGAAVTAQVKYENEGQYDLDSRKLDLYQKQRDVLDKMKAPISARLPLLREELRIERERLEHLQVLDRTAQEISKHKTGNIKEDQANEAVALQTHTNVVEQQGKMLDKVNVVRRSMLEGVVGTLAGIATGSSATMSRGVSQAQIERSGYTQGSLQTEAGFVNPETGKTEGANTQTYSQMANSLFGLTQSREPAQQVVEEIQKTSKLTQEQIDKITGLLESITNNGIKFGLGN